MNVSYLPSRTLFAGCLLLVAIDPSPALAQGMPAAPEEHVSEQIGEYLANFHEAELFSGSVLVANAGEVVYRGAFGLANADWKIPSSVDTKYQLASISKQFTAMLTLLLVEEGSLALDAPIARYLPDYVQANAELVTVHHLLNHTSGIPNFTNRPGFMQSDAQRSFSMDEFIAKFCSDPLEFEPGAHYHYSNSGYYLLAAIIETAAGKSYAAALQEMILDPLGMRDTGHSDSSAVLANRATGYNELLGRRRGARRLDPANFIGAGSLYSTVDDLWKWDQALRSDQLIAGELKEKMFTGGSAGNGYGWFIDRDRPDQPVFWHGGSVSGFTTLIHRTPALGQSIILLGNSGGAATDAILAGVGELLRGATPQPPVVDLDKELARRILDDGVESALVEFALVPNPGEHKRIEDSLNVFGYRLLGIGCASEGVKLLTFNTRAFPLSANTWDSLGEAHMLAGDHDLAIASYRKALELDPRSATAVAALLKLGVVLSPEILDAATGSLDAWPAETFALPPSFAPDLPTGVESLRFAPGWRDPASEEFWSYGFVLWLEEPTPDAERIGELLDSYYDGLMLTFAGGAGRDIGSDPASVKVARKSAGHFEAEMHVTDAFATFEPMALRVLVSTTIAANDQAVLRVQVSPQPKEHWIWSALQDAVDGIQKP